MADIVERLRCAEGVGACLSGDTSFVQKAMSEAADEIERLREALKPFAAVADDFDADGRILYDIDGIYANTVRDFRRAQEALRAPSTAVTGNKEG